MKKTIGIIGNGFVGGAVANGLKSFADIRIYDTLKERSTHHYNDVIFSDFIFLIFKKASAIVYRWHIGGTLQTVEI